jgi:hypothetical protein
MVIFVVNILAVDDLGRSKQNESRNEDEDDDEEKDVTIRRAFMIAARRSALDEN